MIKILILMGAAMFLSSCGHLQHETTREPSSQVGPVQQCGEMIYSESSHMAWNKEDLSYSLRLDCNRDGLITEADKNVAIVVPLAHIKKGQKKWLTIWKREAAMNQKMNPYLCMKVQATADPCITGHSVYGTEPSFTSRVANVQPKNKKKN